MRLRQLVLACSLSSFVLSPYASALGLGEVKLKSSLNQPLEAEVKLLDTRDLTAEQILVTLASPADFERNGVDRLYFYTELQFQVDLESADGPKVIIRSRNPVREPYLNFLIEARWTAGRLLREYTLLMDLPTFEEDARPASVSAAATAAPAQRYQEAPAAPRATAPSSRSTSPTKPALSGDQYEVRANDTLWEIALRARPNSNVSVYQSMMALYRANPEAFINGNINKLRRGQVLRIPDASDMTSVARTEAVSQFAQATGDSSYGAQLNASRRSNTARIESAEIAGRVKLAAPSAGTNSSGQGSGANDGAGRALEGELAATLEELDKTKSENTELGSRVKDLEAQIETMERLVAVSNEKLRALQLAAGQEVASVEVSSSPAPGAAAVVEVATSSVAAAQPPQPTPPKPAPVIQQPVKEQGIFDSLKDNPLWLALAVLGVFGAGAAAYAYRRRQQAEEEQIEDDTVFAFDEPAGEQDDQALTNDDDISGSIENSLFEEDTEATAVAETGDVVGEADIYIAYGKLDQAEEMLLNALEKDPQSTDIRMKLLEVYAQQQNASGFDKHYAVLLPVAGAALLSRASELRETIPSAGEFSAPANASIDDDFNGFSLDDLDSGDLVEPEVASAQPLADGEFNFDFDLDLDDDEETIASLESTDAAKSGVLDDVSEFDFDLSDAEVNLSSDATTDISDLSSALDGLEVKSVAADSNVSALEIDEDFNFDFEDDLNLADSLQNTGSAPESLDVVADDFNLDMDVDDVDLAALDHEMESLDVSFDDEPAVTKVVATKIAKDEAEFGLDPDDNSLPLHASLQHEEGLEFLAEDLGSTKLVLTDDLDKMDEIEFDTDLLGGGDNEISGEVSNIGFDLPESSLDFESLNEELAALGEQSVASGSVVDTEEIIDLELNDAFPSMLDNVDELQAFAESLGDGDAQDANQQAPSAPAFEQSLELDQDEDLFAEALSDFDAESDELDLDAYSSDESTLADLSDEEMDSELDFLADADEAATKLDLARAYIDMGDTEGAKDILSEVVSEGSDEQRKEATELLGRIV
jgi:pilus assembly protein FimV